MKLLNALKAAALVALIAVAAGVFLVLLQLSSAVKHTDAALNGKNGVLAGMSTTLAGVDQTVAKAGGTLDSVNRLCPGPTDPIRPCGVLADVNRTLASIRQTVGQVEIAAIHENAQLTTIDNQERTLFADLHEVLSSSAGTARAATSAIATADGMMSTEKPHLDQLLQLSETDLGDVHTMLANPDVPVITKHVAGMTASGDEMLKDGADKLHQMTHPDKKKLGFWAGTAAAGDWARHFMPPIF